MGDMPLIGADIPIAVRRLTSAAARAQLPPGGTVCNTRSRRLAPGPDAYTVMPASRRSSASHHRPDGEVWCCNARPRCPRATAFVLGDILARWHLRDFGGARRYHGWLLPHDVISTHLIQGDHTVIVSDAAPCQRRTGNSMAIEDGIVPNACAICAPRSAFAAATGNCARSRTKKDRHVAYLLVLAASRPVARALPRCHHAA